jgi:hypothetical protein
MNFFKWFSNDCIWVFVHFVEQEGLGGGRNNIRDNSYIITMFDENLIVFDHIEEKCSRNQL